MKVRFYSILEDCAVYAQVPAGNQNFCHLTYGVNIKEAVYMAHDLIACLKDSEDTFKPFEYTLDEAFKDMEELEVSSSTYIGTLDIDVDTRCTGYVIRQYKNEDEPNEFYANIQWVSKGDKFPTSRYYHQRWNVLRKAYALMAFNLLDERRQ